MKVIHCIASPDLEAPHLSEWIKLHLEAGFDKIFIYNIGPPMYKKVPMWFKTGSGLQLKQVERECQNFNQKEIEEMWESSIISYHSYVCERKIHIENRTRSNFYQTQEELLNIGMKEYLEIGATWVANIDADEVICGNLNVLDNQDCQVGNVRIYQKIFPNVRLTGSFEKGRQLGQISQSLLSECYKNIVQPKKLLSWGNVHYGVSLKGGYKQFNGEEILYFEHHCGPKHKKCPKSA